MQETKPSWFGTIRSSWRTSLATGRDACILADIHFPGETGRKFDMEPTALFHRRPTERDVRSFFPVVQRFDDLVEKLVLTTGCSALGRPIVKIETRFCPDNRVSLWD
jgi:hypothetical protein